MRQKKISESLTIRVFLITAFLLLFAGAIAFGFIAWVAPSTYTAVMNDDLAAQVVYWLNSWQIPNRKIAESYWTSLPSRLARLPS